MVSFYPLQICYRRANYSSWMMTPQDSEALWIVAKTQPYDADQPCPCLCALIIFTTIPPPGNKHAAPTPPSCCSSDSPQHLTSKLICTTPTDTNTHKRYCEISISIKVLHLWDWEGSYKEANLSFAVIESASGFKSLHLSLPRFELFASSQSMMCWLGCETWTVTELMSQRSSFHTSQPGFNTSVSVLHGVPSWQRLRLGARVFHRH